MKTAAFVVLTLFAFGVVTGISQNILTAIGAHTAWSILALVLGLVAGRLVWGMRHRIGKAETP